MTLIAGSANADVCDTPSKLGDMGSFPGEVITISGSLMEKDEEMMTNTLSCFEKATGATVEYGGSDSFEQQIVIDIKVPEIYLKIKLYLMEIH